MDPKALSALVKKEQLGDDDKQEVTSTLTALLAETTPRASIWNMEMVLLQRLAMWDEMSQLVARHPTVVGVGNHVQLISMYAARGEFKEAEVVLAKVKGTKDHHFRFYAPLLAAYCRTEPEQAFRLWQEVWTAGLLPTEGALIDLLSANLTAAQKEEIRSGVPYCLETVTSTFWGTGATIADDGTCYRCRQRLVLRDIGSQALEDIRSRICGSIKLGKTPDYDVVIDGANAGFYANGGQTDRIDPAKINRILSMLPKASKPLVVLHCRHRKSFSRVRGPIYATPYGQNDDIWAIALVLARNCLIVTNDLMSDHAWAALRQKELARWKTIHVIRFTLDRLEWPAKFTRCVQRPGGVWHYPAGEALWLCAGGLKPSPETTPDGSSASDGATRRVSADGRPGARAGREALHVPDVGAGATTPKDSVPSRMGGGESGTQVG